MSKATKPRLEGEIWAFLRMLDGYRENGHYLSHRFRYNGIECGGIVTILPHTYHLRIMPCRMFDDIGAGPGQTIYKDFKRPRTTEIKQDQR